MIKCPWNWCNTNRNWKIKVWPQDKKCSLG